MGHERVHEEFSRLAFDLLVGMESDILAMIRSGPDEKRIMAVFQAIRTIGDSSSLFELERVHRFANAMERLMDEVNSGRLHPDPSLLNTLLEGAGILEGIVLGKSAREKEGETERHMLELLEHSITSESAPVGTRGEPFREAEPGFRKGSQAWHISCSFNRNCLQRGLDPLSPLHQLERFGIIERLEMLDDALPPLPSLNPELLHLGFEIRFRSLVSRQRIEDVFSYFQEDSDIRLIPPGSTVDAYIKLLDDHPRPPVRLGEILVACGAITRRELDRALSRQMANPDRNEPLGRILVEEQVASPAVIDAALERQKALRRRIASDEHAVRVEPSRIDALVEQVGELVTASAAAGLVVSGMGNVAGSEAMETMARLVERVRDSALALRMIPIGTVFRRFPGLVGEISGEAGKRVELDLSGTETEIDKSMVDRLADPLRLLVRHAIEHGIESEADRIATGKPPRGTIRLAARQETGNLVVEVADDGRGLRRETLLERAVRNGIVPPESSPSDEEILELVFHPGLAGAKDEADDFRHLEGISEARKKLEPLRGEIEVESAEGAGTTFRLRLPLTLSIIDGFRFLVGETSYVVPLDSIQECADLPPGSVQAGVVRLRDEPLPFVRLRELFAAAGPTPSRESLVVVQHGTQRVGLVVDRLAGELQAVVKPLGAIFQGLQAVSGTAVLGDGSVALVLDIPHLGKVAARRSAPDRSNLASVQKSITTQELK